MSTGFGSGDGLLRTIGGLSNSSLSSAGSSFMTGAGTMPEDESDVLGVRPVLLWPVLLR